MQNDIAFLCPFQRKHLSMASKNSETSWRVVGDKKSRFIFGNQQTFYFGRFIRFLFTIPSSSLNFKPFCPTHSKTWVSQDLHIFMLIPGIFLGNHFVVVLAFSYFFYFQDHYTMASRLKWTTQEEELLKTLGSTTQKNKWTQIAKLINDQLPQIQRTPKQCRQKYNNHLIFGDRSYDGNWSQLQDEKLFNEYKEKGPRWKNISESFPTKSQNTIKNRFYGNVRKIVRKLNKIGKEKISKSFKPIRQKSIIRIIQPDVGLIELSENVLQQMRGLREKLIEIIKIGIEQNESQQIQKLEDYIALIKQIHNFNCKCRFLRNFKPRSQRKLSKVSKENQNIKNTEANEEGSEQISEQENGDSFNSNYEDSCSQSPEQVQEEGLNNTQKKSSSPIKGQKMSTEGQNTRDLKKYGKIEKKKSQNTEIRQKRASSNHIINRIHQYVVEYCFGFDEQCYELLVLNKQQ